MRKAGLLLAPTLLVVAGAMLLAGCAPQVVYAANDGIVFTDIGEPSPDVLRVAQAHCHRFGKRTRYDGRDEAFRLKFQCVE